MYIKCMESVDYSHSKRLHDRPKSSGLKVPTLDCVVNAATLHTHTPQTTGHLGCMDAILLWRMMMTSKQNGPSFFL
jgi:hypothetical protein